MRAKNLEITDELVSKARGTYKDMTGRISPRKSPKLRTYLTYEFELEHDPPGISMTVPGQALSVSEIYIRSQCGSAIDSVGKVSHYQDIESYDLDIDPDPDLLDTLPVDRSFDVMEESAADKGASEAQRNEATPSEKSDNDAPDSQ